MFSKEFRVAEIDKLKTNKHQICEIRTGGDRRRLAEGLAAKLLTHGGEAALEAFGDGGGGADESAMAERRSPVGEVARGGPRRRNRVRVRVFGRRR